MDKSPENTEQTKTSSSRRGFLKKAVYTAPALLVLGTLTKTKDAEAGGVGGPPPSLHQPPG